MDIDVDILDINVTSFGSNSERYIGRSGWRTIEKVHFSYAEFIIFRTKAKKKCVDSCTTLPGNVRPRWWRDYSLRLIASRISSTRRKIGSVSGRSTTETVCRDRLPVREKFWHVNDRQTEFHCWPWKNTGKLSRQ